MGVSIRELYIKKDKTSGMEKSGKMKSKKRYKKRKHDGGRMLRRGDLGVRRPGGGPRESVFVKCNMEEGVGLG